MNRKSFIKTIPIIGISSGLVVSGCSTGTGAELENNVGDLAILSNAALREATAVQTYDAAAGLLSTQQILDTSVYYRSHHQEHLDLFNELIDQLDGNPILLDSVSADSRISTANDEESAIKLAMTLEMEAAQAYLQDALVNLTTANAKSLMGSIYPVELSHFVTLNAVLGASPSITGATFTEIFNNFDPVS